LVEEATGAAAAVEVGASAGDEAAEEEAAEDDELGAAVDADSLGNEVSMGGEVSVGSPPAEVDIPVAVGPTEYGGAAMVEFR